MIRLQQVMKEEDAKAENKRLREDTRGHGISRQWQRGPQRSRAAADHLVPQHSPGLLHRRVRVQQVEELQELGLA